MPNNKKSTCNSKLRKKKTIYQLKKVYNNINNAHIHKCHHINNKQKKHKFEKHR